MKKKFAVFDIDGTVFRSHLYHEVFLELARLGHLPEESTKIYFKSLDMWRSRKASFDEFDTSIIDASSDFIKNINPKIFDETVEKIIDQHKDRVYVYTREMIKTLKNEGYVILAISGSHIESVKHFALHHGFDDWIGQTYGRDKEGNKFTGIELKTFKNKHIFLDKFVKKHNLTYKGSYGVGDTKGDISMLEEVDNPIAFNPTKELLDHAMEHNWKVVVERKSIAYEMKGKNGTYVLAQATTK